MNRTVSEARTLQGQAHRIRWYKLGLTRRRLSNQASAQYERSMLREVSAIAEGVIGGTQKLNQQKCQGGTNFDYVGKFSSEGGHTMGDRERLPSSFLKGIADLQEPPQVTFVGHVRLIEGVVLTTWVGCFAVVVLSDPPGTEIGVVTSEQRAAKSA
jgi:hypothetical protein